MSYSDLYDFEGIVETAAAQALRSFKINNPATSQDTQTIQKTRPRVEIKFQLGPGMNEMAIVLGTPPTLLQNNTALAAGLTPAQLFDYRRETAWMFTLVFSVITAAKMSDHASYRANARAAIANIWTLMNQIPGSTNPGLLTRHRTTLSRDGGNGPVLISHEKDLFKTDITFEGKIAIQGDAWPQLAV